MCHVNESSATNWCNNCDFSETGNVSDHHNNHGSSSGLDSDLNDSSVQGVDTDYPNDIDTTDQTSSIGENTGEDSDESSSKSDSGSAASDAMQPLMQLLQQFIEFLKNAFGIDLTSGGRSTSTADGSGQQTDNESPVSVPDGPIDSGESVDSDVPVDSEVPVDNGSQIPTTSEETDAPEDTDNTVDSPTESPGTTASGSSMPGKSGLEEMDRWDDAIAKAAQSTGLPANYIKATMYAESRGNPDDQSTNPDGQHQDMGLMQISDYTYGLVMESQPDAPKGLDVNSPEDNIMAGAWELKDKSEKAGGDLAQTSAAYVGHGDDSDNVYAEAVLHFMECLDNGQPLPDEYKGF